MFKIFFDNTYSRLPISFFEKVLPTKVADPKLIQLNAELAKELNLDFKNADPTELAEIFSGNKIPEGADPIAMAYAGHQFGHFVPQLGDGRAILIGETVDINGRHRDIHLKGAGPTPFSRRGDGRAALGPVMREYIVSEAMFHLQIPTTRSLAFVTTGEKVLRDKELPGAILTRVALSHIRVGTFEYFAARDDHAGLRKLADYSIERHYPICKEDENPYRSFYLAVIDAQAKLIAKWLAVGFIHGVMNTDNMTISGETIDYGPCAFMDEYDPATVFSSIDQQGRYAYANQPSIAHWNLQSLGACLIPILHNDKNAAIHIVEDALALFKENFKNYYLTEMCLKLGLQHPIPEDFQLIEDFLNILQENKSDYTLSFRFLAESIDQDEKNSRLYTTIKNSPTIQRWLTRWRDRLHTEKLNSEYIKEKILLKNPIYIPRNHLIEQSIQAAYAHNDFSKMHRLISILKNPHVEQPEAEKFTLPPKENERVLQTFCGT